MRMTLLGSLTALGLLVLSGCGGPGAPLAEAPGSSNPLGNGVTTAERVRALLEEGTMGGTVGLYLRELGGAVHAEFREDFKFEPASTIKALVHFHAMRWVQDEANGGGTINALLDGTQIERASAACPPGVASESLRTALGEMMLPSSNFWTRALQDHFGEAAIDATRIALGMTDTQFQRVLGCGGQPGGDSADPNQPSNHLTLIDAGSMYEAVATGFLSPATRDAGFPGALMVTHQGLFETIVDEEAVGLGLSPSAVSSFKTLRRSANKPGGVTLDDGLRYLSLAGWARIAFKDAACQIDPREFVYGVFRHGADPDHEFLVSTATAATELFREQIRAGLESWAACEADLQVIGSSFVDPPAEIDVNTPTMLTVRHQVRNGGPAAIVDARVATSFSAPADCTLSPVATNRDVLGLALGVITVVDEVVELACTDPSFHLFEVHATIAPLDPNVNDPNPGNNASATSATIALIALADLAILDWDVAALDGAGLGDLLVGQDFEFDTFKTLRNLGDQVKGLYAEPVDATVTVSLDIPAGLRGAIRDGNVTLWTAGPATISRDVAVAGLEVGLDRVITETFGLHCLEPGLHDIVLRNEVAADDEHIEDPDPSNDVVELQRTIECVTPVQINIRPGTSRNHANPTGTQAMPVAILTTDAGEYGLPLDFDATTVDPSTVKFGTVEALGAGGGTAAWPDRGFVRDSFEMDDRTKDGDLDMVLLVRVAGSGIDVDTTEACLVGTYRGEGAGLYTFFGCDVVRVIPPGN